MYSTPSPDAPKSLVFRLVKSLVFRFMASVSIQGILSFTIGFTGYEIHVGSPPPSLIRGGDLRPVEKIAEDPQKILLGSKIYDQK